LGQQRLPVVRRIAAGEHRGKDRVSISSRTVSAQRLAVIDPCVDDDPRRQIITEKQPEPPVGKLFAEPVFSPLSERGALPVARQRRILGNSLQRDLDNVGEDFCIGAGFVPFRIFRAFSLDAAGETLELRQEKWMGIDRPSVDGERLAQSATSSSMVDCRSTATPSTSAASRFFNAGGNAFRFSG
jgi:hypothetical protein